MKILAMLGFAAVAFVATGCNDNASYHSIRNNLTPELSGVASRPVDRDRIFHVTANMDFREMNDDIMRTFYIDSPMRLSPYPIVNNGLPR
ncbi:MAG TPA: hypothetical protein VG711_13140 [Phycisphaerales bacterium]|nr:hypothetical protein [Phycisphaerales bacterium]